MTEEADYIMNKMSEIIQMYFETKGEHVSENEVAFFSNELNIGVKKLEQLIK